MGVLGIATSSSPSSNSGDKSTSGEGLNSRRRESASSEVESSVSDTEGVSNERRLGTTALDSGMGWRGQMVRKK